MSRLAAFVEILRPVNSLMVGLAIIVGVICSGGLGAVPLGVLALSFTAGFTLTGASMVINDYYDRAIDAVNEPARPIPSGRVKEGEAIAYTAALSAVGLASAYLTGPVPTVIGFAAWVLMMLYSSWGKRTGFPGNLLVASCVALPFVYGGALSGNLTGSSLFSLLAFLTTAGREVTKGIVDTVGDGQRGVQTIAVRHGAERAAQVACFLFLAAVLVSLLPIQLRLVSAWYLPLVAVTDAGLLYGSARLLRNPSRETSRSVKNQILVWMLFGLAAFAAGSLLH